MINGTAIGKAVLEDVALWATPKKKVKVPAMAREMTMVMIPKTGRQGQRMEADSLGKHSGEAGGGVNSRGFAGHGRTLA